MVKILNKYVLCEKCGEVWIKKIYVGHKFKPLCRECRAEIQKSKQIKGKGKK